MHKSFLIMLSILLISNLSSGQEHETVLSAPDNWKSEIIPFPIGFAQEIAFDGIEDLRFAPSWSDSTSPNFWTYTFVWYIEENDPMTEDKLTEYFNYYYDGLMGVNVKDKGETSNGNQLDKTLCLFIKSEEGFTGKMRVYDNFFTKDYMTLNIKVKELFCPKMKKQIINCDISLQPIDHEVWSLFDDVQLAITCE